MAYSILGTVKVLQPAAVVALGLPILRARGLQAVNGSPSSFTGGLPDSLSPSGRTSHPFVTVPLEMSAGWMVQLRGMAGRGLAAGQFQPIGT
jgi:hypothetical protein